MPEEKATRPVVRMPLHLLSRKSDIRADVVMTVVFLFLWRCNGWLISLRFSSGADPENFLITRDKYQRDCDPHNEGTYSSTNSIYDSIDLSSIPWDYHSHFPRYSRTWNQGRGRG